VTGLSACGGSSPWGRDLIQALNALVLMSSCDGACPTVVRNLPTRFLNCLSCRSCDVDCSTRVTASPRIFASRTERVYCLAEGKACLTREAKSCILCSGCTESRGSGAELCGWDWVPRLSAAPQGPCFAMDTVRHLSFSSYGVTVPRLVRDVAPQGAPPLLTEGFLLLFPLLFSSLWGAIRSLFGST